MLSKILFYLGISFFFCNISFAKVSDFDTQHKAWNQWLETLKTEMIDKGISRKTIKKAYKNDYFHVVKDVKIKDEEQPEFIMSSSQYINRIVNKKKVLLARKHYKELKPKYEKLSKEYGVPLNYLIAFWGIETHFGYNKGKYHLIDGLTNLSYKNRRSAFFKKELFNILKIMDTYDLDDDKLLGSWAGAMGHFQFMPSTYNAYAVDYDKDGVADIWDSFDDAIASAAHYLSELGWVPNEQWGQEVKLPWNFDYNLVGPRKFKSVKQWKNIGIISADGKGIRLPADALAAVTLPDGKCGNAYLTLSNFRRIMIWNRSTNYALAVSRLADYLVNSKNYKPIPENTNYRLTHRDIKHVQYFANRILRTHLKEDGKLGPKTAAAVKRLQRKWKFPQDGMPDYRLLQKIKNYKSRNDFKVPSQPRKPKR